MLFKKLINFHIKLGKLVAVLALLLIAPAAWAASWTVPGDAATPQALFDDNALSDGDSLTFTGAFATLDLSGVAETGIFYVSGNFTIGTITGKVGLALIGNGLEIRQATINLGNNANLQGFRFVYAVAGATPDKALKGSDGGYIKTSTGGYVITQ